MKARGRDRGSWKPQRAAPQASQCYVISRFRCIRDPVVEYHSLQALQVLHTTHISAPWSSWKENPQALGTVRSTYQQMRKELLWPVPWCSWILNKHTRQLSDACTVWTVWPLKTMCTLRDGKDCLALSMIPRGNKRSWNQGFPWTLLFAVAVPGRQKQQGLLTLLFHAIPSSRTLYPLLNFYISRMLHKWNPEVYNLREFFFPEKVSLCNSGWPGTYYAD